MVYSLVRLFTHTSIRRNNRQALPFVTRVELGQEVREERCRQQRLASVSRPQPLPGPVTRAIEVEGHVRVFLGLGARAGRG